MKQLSFLAILVCLSTGCMSTKGLDKVVSALGKDPASVHIRVSSIYGVIEISRTNPGTNGMTHTVSPDGTITVTEKENR